jgi:hypothetical protein
MTVVMKKTMKHLPLKYLLLFTVLFFQFFLAQAQSKKTQVSFKDSLDGKLDLSDFIIDANGFIPIPYIITEPAFGGFGGAIAPVFIKKRPPYVDTINGRVQKTPVAPDITGGLGLYTVNHTWGLMGFRSGTIIKSRIKYLAAGGYFHLNLSFYKNVPQLGEKEFHFTINTIPAILQAIKRVGHSGLHMGFRYLFLKTDISFNGDHQLRSFTDSLDFNKLISQLGVVLELDKRDNVFTPDKGIKLHFDATKSDQAIGSDYDFWRLNYYNYLYQPIFDQTVFGLRIDVKQAFGDIPFYALPFIEMRGIPLARYQGNANLVSEVEIRQDIKRRWSIVGFGGTGKAFDYWDQFDNADWIFSYGGGVRYLLARKFKLRMGIDLARGAGAWSYYIVFGSNWQK